MPRLFACFRNVFSYLVHSSFAEVADKHGNNQDQ